MIDQTTRDLIQQGVEKLRAGDKAAAHELLLQVTVLAPDYQPAWLWLSDAAETPDQQREYLERCLAYDPESRSGQIARKKLDRLGWYSPDYPTYSGETPLPWQPDTLEAPPRAQPPVWVLVLAGTIVLVALVGAIGFILPERLVGVNPEPDAGADMPITTEDTTNGGPAAQPQAPAPANPYPEAGSPQALETAPDSAYPEAVAPQTPAAAPDSIYPAPNQSPAPQLTPANPTPEVALPLVPGNDGTPDPEASPPAPAPDAAPTTPESPLDDIPPVPETVAPSPAPLPDVAAYPAEIPDEQVLTAGLGLGRARWEAQQGAPSGELSATIAEYEGGTFIVSFDLESVRTLEYRLPTPTPFEAARAQIQAFLPEDSALQDVDGLPEEGVMTETYRSTWLAMRFPQWFAQPENAGAFTVRYDISDQGVETVTISIM